MNDGCDCGIAPKLIFACSGAADVGAVADLAARRLTREGKGKMFCLAGIGGRVPGIMKSTEAAGGVLAIDGCPVGCVRKCLQEAGFGAFEHLQLECIGLKKNEASPCEENISRACQAGADLLAGMGV